MISRDWRDGKQRTIKTTIVDECMKNAKKEKDKDGKRDWKSHETEKKELERQSEEETLRE